VIACHERGQFVERVVDVPSVTETLTVPVDSIFSDLPISTSS